MQVNPAYPRHIWTKECKVGMDRWLQRESAISLALALRREFTVNRSVLECVKVFKYLGRLLVDAEGPGSLGPSRAGAAWGECNALSSCKIL
jgi:hypothetical protein